jgi:iron(II)-dependent oxidoreductase
MVTQLEATRSKGICSRLLTRLWQAAAASRPSPAASAPVVTDENNSRATVSVEGSDEQAHLVQRFLDLGRAALLLRPAIVQGISISHATTIRETLQHEMAWVAEGNVLLTDWLCDTDEPSSPPTHLEHVPAFYIDRFPVTNQRFREFVAYGGYEQEEVWDATIWPRVGEFVDQSGTPGPRYWSEGQFPAGSAECPVVGVSWFEADAFARWTGKRLPSDAEWVKVAACPAAMTGTLIQRRFPWGDVWDPALSNLWISGLQKPVPVDQFPEGASATGVQQLIGNVWEWMATDLQPSVLGNEFHFESPLKSLRGGAFDTYFENQATCQLQSGDASVARRHNVGFRCALSAADIAGSEPAL